MTIAIFGATGQLGGLTIDVLIRRGTAPGNILALGRNQDRLTELADHGLRTARVDLDDAATLAGVLDGVEKVFLISMNEPGRRVAQHTNAVEAARTAGVRQLVYTSVLEAPTTVLALAPEHRATEELISASGIPATFLRHGWYTENHRQEFDVARQTGVVANSVGGGRIASAPRRDYAEAAAVVLSTPGHEGEAYELSGDTGWTYTEFAAAAQEILGTPVRYEVLTPEQEQKQLIGLGLDEGTAGFLGMLNANMRDGALAPATGELSKLIGRPTEPLIETMRSWMP
ncbi:MULTISPECIES: SDR family oxidoreductase [unclassified Arthrobacter]|uniref:SDR family oxidoreductase n=1 Tax=unclassified Arthrobacter TaxID=235627 RepID=UPI001E2C9518|nr:MULTISPECIES: SDR family oxidoreductase [unclassified Arthrobacter]MCC9145166.1 SDR family oxidoreductase [Arthrobacter sp. zg-Y919]MDK1276394.1 SDR family oxidoreductase [Arthrobacter sp. zg.Y919]WIB02005.1 SDR family oxidoreductase [Arthrobacter sp. zg-Y919]